MAFEITKVQEDFLAKVLTKIEPFTELFAEQIDEMVNASERIHLKKGNSIYRPGDHPKHLFVLMEGSIKVSTPNFGYKEVIHDLLNSPSIFGLANCYTEGVIKNNAICISSNSICYAIPFSIIKRLMNENSDFNLQLFIYLSQSIKEKERRVEQLMLADARERVIKFIRDHAIKKGVRIGYEILLKHNFTQQDIADFAGTSRQTVTNILKDLKEKNKIHVERRSILIRDINDFR